MLIGSGSCSISSRFSLKSCEDDRDTLALPKERILHHSFALLRKALSYSLPTLLLLLEALEDAFVSSHLISFQDGEAFFLLCQLELILRYPSPRLAHIVVDNIAGQRNMVRWFGLFTVARRC